jgi:hypothetical protein
LSIGLGRVVDLSLLWSLTASLLSGDEDLRGEERNREREREARMKVVK